MNKVRIIIAGFILVLMAVCCFQCNRIKSIKADLNTQKENVDVLRRQQVNYTIADSIQVSAIQSLQLTKKQLNDEIVKKDAQISKLQTSKKEKIVEYCKVTKTDTFFLTKADTVRIGNDTCVAFADQYVDAIICADTASIIVNDTLKNVITKMYKHRFMWFKWGDGGYRQHMWSTNPHSHIKYDQFITIDE